MSLTKVLEKIAEEHKGNLMPKSKIYCNVDLAKAFEKNGFKGDRYLGVYVIVPLRKLLSKKNYSVNGAAFVELYQLDSGIVLPEWVAKESGLKYNKYKPKDLMTLTEHPK